MRKPLLATATVALALALAGSASAAQPALLGVVVGSQHGTVLVATRGGAVRAVAGRARVGARVSVAGTRVRVVGRARLATFRGVVVRRSGGLTFLSAAQHLLVVRSAHARTLSSARDSGAPAGTVVQATVGIDDQGELAEQSEQQVGQQAGPVQVQATVTAVAAGSVTLSVNGQPLTVPLPAGLTLPASLVGTQVTLTLSFANGQTTASGQADDQGDDGGGAVGKGSGSISLNGGTVTQPSQGGSDSGGGGDD